MGLFDWLKGKRRPRAASAKVHRKSRDEKLADAQRHLTEILPPDLQGKPTNELTREQQQELLDALLGDPRMKEFLLNYVRQLVGIAERTSFLSTIGRMEARQIGVELDLLGGKRLMQEICMGVGGTLPPNAGQLGMGTRRELESAWDGIGQWRA